MALNYLKNLNMEQREATVFGKGPLLIIAGAGTGKTTVITCRVAHLISKKFLEPKNILALTFTEKAAQEMEERVDMLLPFGYLDLWVSTFHSFGQRVLKENAIDIGLARDFNLLDKTDAWLLVRQNLERFKLDYYKPLGNPTKFIDALLEHFLRLKDQGIEPKDYQNYAKKTKDKKDAPRIKEIALAYKTYQDILTENSALDFGDLINYTLMLFKKRPAILEKYRNQFKYILIDEFQDTNWSQYELVKTLSAPKNNLTVCADDDQAIYRWRGASFNNVLQFKKNFPRSKEVFLIKNYRSGQGILDLSYKFIQLNNPDRLEHQLKQNKKSKKASKKLLSQTKSKGIVEHLHFRTLEEEVRGVVDKIETMLDKKTATSFSDFSILVRANDYALPFVREFERRGLAHQFFASSGLYSQPIILDIISYFKLLDNYHESRAFYRILKIPVFDVLERDIAKISNFSRMKAKSFYESLEDMSLIDGLIPASKEKINFLFSLLNKHSRIGSISNVFINFLNDSGYLKHLVKKEKSREIELLSQFFSKIRQFEEKKSVSDLKSFLEELSWELESGNEGKIDFNIEEGPDTIKIMTIHSAKGLEFPFVFLVNLVDKRFPTIERGEEIEIPDELRKDIMPSGDAHLQEERRLFYVAMTRAKKGLFLTSAKNYGGQREKKLSRFLYELDMNKTKEKTLSKIILKTRKPKKKGKKEISLPGHFSYTQIAAFKNCPLQYKFAHILKIPRPGSGTLSFGKTMHNTLFRFMKEFYQTKDWKLEDIYKIYKEEWLDEWYESKTHRRKYYELGKKSLKNFVKDLKEKKPKIKMIGNNPCLEADFSLKIGKYVIKGKIDRIDDLGGSDAEIIDYKTGKPKEKLLQDEKEQLLIYLIAAQDVFKIKPKTLAYYYLDASKKLIFFPSEKEKNDFKNELVKKITAIEKSDFSPTPGRHCRFCDFKDICEFRKVY